MKTKIIYISGNELFDMADIRNAFEEVRSALSLGSDTILFGVPVDNDDAFVQPDAPTPENESVIDVDEQDVDIAPIQSPKVVPITRATATKKVVKPVEEPVEEMVEESIEEIKDVEPDENIDLSEPIEINQESDADIPDSADDNPDEHVIPILSVLGSENKEPTDVDTEIEPAVENEPAEITETETVTISDMIADDIPTNEPEKTLEELLERITPLGEDAEKQVTPAPAPTQPEPKKASKKNKSDDDTDATLEKLATEFFENQDKIGVPEKPASRSKMGKLKNFIPFHPKKQEANSLMGDLFGWAGVAANDDDFTIPGFFK